MIPTLSQVCSLPSPLETDLEHYAAGGCRSIELWWGKVETFLETHAAADLRDLLERHELSAPVVSYQGGLFAKEEAARGVHWEHFQRRLDVCRELGVETMVVAADLAGALEQADLDAVTATLAQAARAAGQRGMQLALEFQASSPFVNNLQTAAALVAEAASPHLGICLDAFHYGVGPSKREDLQYLDETNLLHVQVCDLSGVARELALDGDRILPGDGDLPLATIVDRLREIDYRRAVSIELMNPRIWQTPARQFAEIAVDALRRLLETPPADDPHAQ
jgi:sugar phosphate isomerase/epimerase